jgi:hypothetical protein
MKLFTSSKPMPLLRQCTSLVYLCLLGCDRVRVEPPSFQGGPLNASPLPGLFAPASVATSASGSTSNSTSNSKLNAGDAGTAPDASVDTPELNPKDAALPQTKARPSTDSPLVQGRARALFNAIQRDDPSLAMPFFFPKEAYEQVKAIQNPAADWKARLVHAFERDIHTLHARIGEADTFDRLEVPEPRTGWVNEGEEGNRLGYFRVYGSKLHFKHGANEAAIELKSLISWRGEWFVVHLSGFK